MFLGKKIIMHWSVNVHLKDRKWKETVLKDIQFSLWCQKKSCNRWKLVCTIWCEPTVEPKLRDNLPSCSFYVVLREYSTDVTNIGLWSSSREHFTNSICVTVILLSSKAWKLDLALLASCSTLLGKLRCFVHTCTYNLATG